MALRWRRDATSPDLIKNTHKRRRSSMVNKEFMAKELQAIKEAYVNGNVDALNETFAPDITSHRFPFPDIKGLEAYKQYVTMFRQAFTDIQWDFEESISEGDTLARRYTMRMKHTGASPMLKIPPTGKELSIKGCVFDHVKDNKIIEIFEYDDSLGLLQQLGIVPPMG
jgi:predicted ester cyclase